MDVKGEGNMILLPVQTILKMQALYTKTRKASFNYYC